MKKKYEKPVLFVESFELSQHIANCGVNANDGSPLGKPLHGQGSCAFMDGMGRRLFTTSVSACKTKTEDGSIGGYCYNTPTPKMQVFTS